LQRSTPWARYTDVFFDAGARFQRRWTEAAVVKRISLDDPDLDRYTRFVLGHIDQDVRRSLTAEQLDAIRQAIDATKPLSKHPFDVRGVIPLFFARYYFVFLAGRDKRKSLEVKELGRRRNTYSAVGAIVLSILLLIPLGALLIIVGYAMKSFLGIDIMPDRHFGDLLR
jgi:hypothetical protein